MPKVRRSALRKRILQRREGDTTPLTSDRNKTAAMLLKEVEYNQDIVAILTSGPLLHNSGGVSSDDSCNRCIQCRYGIKKSTASLWRKRLGISNYEEVA